MTTIYSSPNQVPTAITGHPIYEVIDSATNRRGFTSGTASRVTVDSITAHAGGTQAAGLLLTGDINVVTTVGSANDSVLLPPSIAGMVVYVVNAAASNSMQVFGSGTDTINAVATATGVAQAAGKSAVYFCATAGAWWRVLSA